MFYQYFLVNNFHDTYHNNPFTSTCIAVPIIKPIIHVLDGIMEISRPTSLVTPDEGGRYADGGLNISIMPEQNVYYRVYSRARFFHYFLCLITLYIIIWAM